MTRQRPIIRTIISNDEHQVLPFRPGVRRATRPRLITANPPPPDRIFGPRGTSQRQTALNQTALNQAALNQAGDDFRHRMVSNMAALAVTMALTALGIWLVASIAHIG